LLHELTSKNSSEQAEKITDLSGLTSKVSALACKLNKKSFSQMAVLIYFMQAMSPI
jgi:hypothetical protein